MKTTQSIDKLIKKEEKLYRKGYLKLILFVNNLNGKDPVKLKYNDHGAYMKYHRMKKTLKNIQKMEMYHKHFLIQFTKKLTLRDHH